MFENFSSRLQTFKRFYHRNDTAFACIGLVIGMHIVWWQLQQNKRLVPKESRLKHIGPLPVVYLDETEYYQNKRQQAREEAERK
jgi:hypothetical protein